MNFLVIRNNLQMTVLYRDNNLRVCRQTFAIMRSKETGGLIVATWADSDKKEAVLAATPADLKEAVDTVGHLANQFIAFARDRLRKEMMSPLGINLTEQPGGGYIVTTGSNPNTSSASMSNFMRTFTQALGDMYKDRH